MEEALSEGIHRGVWHQFVTGCGDKDKVLIFVFLHGKLSSGQGRAVRSTKQRELPKGRGVLFPRNSEGAGKLEALARF